MLFRGKSFSITMIKTTLESINFLKQPSIFIK